VIRTTPKYYSGPSDSTVVMELLLPRRRHWGRAPLGSAPKCDQMLFNL